MQVNLKKLIGGTALGLALLTNTAPTWAGERSQSEVTVTATEATGTMNGARYSTDTRQFIGCWTAGNTGYANAGCYTVDRNSASLTCLTHTSQRGLQQSLA